jgi:hypothetical protein
LPNDEGFVLVDFYTDGTDRATESEDGRRSSNGRDSVLRDHGRESSNVIAQFPGARRMREVSGVPEVRRQCR